MKSASLRTNFLPSIGRRASAKQIAARVIVPVIVTAAALPSVREAATRSYITSVRALARALAPTRPTASPASVVVSAPLPVSAPAQAPVSAPESRWQRLASDLEAPLREVSGTKKITPTPSGIEIVLPSDPIFWTGTALMHRKNEFVLRELANWIAEKNIDLKVSIESHTDDTPVVKHRREFASNWHLSAARAGALAMLFEDSKVPSGHLTAVGRAASEPASPEPSQNRRIVIRLSNPQGGG